MAFVHEPSDQPTVRWVTARAHEEECRRLRALLRMGVEVVEDFLPNIGSCALQDYGRLNEFLMQSKKEKE